MNKYMLFLFHSNEAIGGIGDLALVGSLDECISAAESSDHYGIAEIVDHETLRIARRGEWVNELRSDRTGLTSDMSVIDWRFEWESDQDAASL